jgi:hypothetical protein
MVALYSLPSNLEPVKIGSVKFYCFVEPNATELWKKQWKSFQAFMYLAYGIETL